MTEERRYTIKQAIEILRPEFPDLTQSALRFLEKKGLVRPERSPGGHRLYSDRDIDRIRLVRRLQAHRFLPLDLIQGVIAKVERAKDPEAQMAFTESLYRPITYDPTFLPVTAAELSNRTGISSRAVHRMEKMGLLFPRQEADGEKRYDEDDLKIAMLVSREMQLGSKLDQLTPYLHAMRALVDEEFQLFKALAGKGEIPPERGRQLREDADVFHAILRTKMLRQSLPKGKHD